MSGAYEDARAVTAALGARAGRRRRIGRDACRQALDRLGESLAMRETAAAARRRRRRRRWRRSARLSTTIGPAEHRSAQAGDDGRGRLPMPRAAPPMRSWPSAAPAVQRLPSLARRPALVRPAQRRAAARPDRSAEAVPLLQPLLAQSRSAGGARGRLGARRHPRSGGGPRHSHRPARRHRRDAAGGHRRARRRARSACRADARRGSSRRASRSARITRSCSRRSRRSALVAERCGGHGAGPCRSPGAGFSARRKLRALKERGVDALARIGSARSAGGARRMRRKPGDRLLRKMPPPVDRKSR